MRPIGLLIKHLHLLHRQNMDNVFQEHDLTSSQAIVILYVLRAYEEGKVICQKDIEQEMEISNPTVTGILNRLEQKELIKRVPGKTDARVRNIIVTDKALELNKMLHQKFKKAEKELLSALTEDEVELFHVMLEKIIDSHEGSITLKPKFEKGDDKL